MKLKLRGVDWKGAWNKIGIDVAIFHYIQEKISQKINI